MIGVNPDRRESDLAADAAGCACTLERKFVRQLSRPPQSASAASDETKYRTVKPLVVRYASSIVVAALAETALASRYMGTQREEL